MLLHGGQSSISLEYQTYTSAHLFDTLVTGMPLPGESGGRQVAAAGSKSCQLYTGDRVGFVEATM